MRPPDVAAACRNVLQPHYIIRTLLYTSVFFLCIHLNGTWGCLCQLLPKLTMHTIRLMFAGASRGYTATLTTNRNSVKAMLKEMQREEMSDLSAEPGMGESTIMDTRSGCQCDKLTS